MAFKWWFTVPIDAINEIGNTISTLPSVIMGYLIQVMIALLFPVSLTLYFLQNIYTLLYNSFAPMYNMVITIGNLPVIILGVFYSIPSPWTTILYISISLSVAVRLIRWLRTIPVLGKYLFGTGDSP